MTDVANKIGDDLLRHLTAAMLADRDTAVAVADVFLEICAPSRPEVAQFFGSAAEEAEWWAEFATDTMVVAMLSACLKRLATRDMIAPKARKRALVAIWNTLGEQDRVAFLEMVDPSPAGKA